MEIQRAAETDSYLKVAMQRYKQLFFKAGYVFRGKNDSAIEYLKKRFRIMEYCTGECIDTMLKEIAGDLETYSNAFLIKTRQDSIPMINAKGTTESGKPVAGYYRIHPATMQAQYNDDGILIGYKQLVMSGREKVFKKEDVIHFTLDREAGSVWGTPRWIAVLEDIKILRKMEANVLSLVYRYAMPLFQVKVGLPQTGFEGTQKELDDTRHMIETMPMDGTFITNERVSMEAVGAQGNALDTTGYLAYFEKRAFSGMNVSESMMGRGGAKQDASTMEENAHNIIKADQQVFSSQVREAILNELLIEGGFNPILNENDIVTFDFNEISLDTKIKMENNELNKFEKNAITFEEMRDNLGLTKDNVSEDRLYSNMISQKNTLEQMELQSENAKELANVNGDIQMDIAKQSAQLSAASASSGSSSSSPSKSGGSKVNATKNAKRTKSSYTKKNTGNGKTIKTNSSSKAVASTNTPQNQHGKYSMKVGEALNKSSPIQKDMSNIFSAISKDILEHNQSISDIIVSGYQDRVNRTLKKHVDIACEKATKKAFKDAGKKIKEASSEAISFKSPAISKYSTKAISNLFSEIKDITCNKQVEKCNITEQLNKIQYRLHFIADYVETKSYWYSYAKSLDYLGVKEAVVHCNEDSIHKDKYNNKILNTADFNIDEIPGYSVGCSCLLMPCKDSEL